MCSLHWTRWYEGRPIEAPKYYARMNKRGWIHKGYKWVSTPEGEVMYHRHLMEKKLGRKLTYDECVHHKNGDKLDNRLTNLEVVPRGSHTSHHRAHALPCLICGDERRGGHGLCPTHSERVRRFIGRFELVIPKRGYVYRVLYMGIALALESTEVEKRLEALQNGDRLENDTTKPFSDSAGV